MLRLLVVALLVVNLLFWAWHHPPIAQALGLPGEVGREPARLRRQVSPEAVRLVSAVGAVPAASEAEPSTSPTRTPRVSAGDATLAMASLNASSLSPAAAPSAPSGPTLCLETGALTNAATTVAQRELTQAGVPAGGWVDIRREVPGRWIIYMGRFTDPEVLQRKTEEVQRLNLSFTVVKAPPELNPGLALGGDFPTQPDAQDRLDNLRGVRTARIVQLPSSGAEHRLRVDRIDSATVDRLAVLSSREGATRWQPCVP